MPVIVFNRLLQAFLFMVNTVKEIRDAGIPSFLNQVQ